MTAWANAWTQRQKTVLERFTEKYVVNDETGCWEWQGCRNGKGYGIMLHAGRSRGAHRVAYKLLVGPLEDGRPLDHLCGNKGCVNPKHLEPVTARENTQRYFAAKTHCRKGHLRTSDNLRRRKGTNSRYCLTCSRERSRRWRKQKAVTA